MIRFWVFLFFWERWWGRSKNNNNSSNNNVYHILYTYIYIYIHIYHTYIATHIHTFICNNKNNKWYQFPFLWTIFLAPPNKSTNPGEDVMRVQQTETFEARLASPLLPFYATWQAVDSDRISTEKRKVVVMPKKRWGPYKSLEIGWNRVLPIEPLKNGRINKWVTGVLKPISRIITPLISGF